MLSLTISAQPYVAPQIFGDKNNADLSITQRKDQPGTKKDPFPDSPTSYPPPPMEGLIEGVYW